ncbi:MAG: MarR family transcriptional regulator, partial [Bacteroidota bacterium]
MYNVEAVKEDITTNIGFVLLHIDDEGTPATKIAPLMGMETRSLTRMLARLEEMGLIYRQKDPNDGRMVRIFLTEEGQKKKAYSKEVVIH